MAAEPDARRQLQAQIRKNITETLVSLRVNTVDDIQQIAAALAQCTVGGAQTPWPHLSWPVSLVTCRSLALRVCEPRRPPSLRGPCRVARHIRSRLAVGRADGRGHSCVVPL